MVSIRQDGARESLGISAMKILNLVISLSKIVSSVFFLQYNWYRLWVRCQSYWVDEVSDVLKIDTELDSILVLPTLKYSLLSLLTPYVFNDG